MGKNTEIWERYNSPLSQFKELDEVRVKTAVLVEEIIGGKVQIQAGWEGTIVECAETHAPMIEFLNYREEPIIAHIETDNLELIS